MIVNSVLVIFPAITRPVSHQVWGWGCWNTSHFLIYISSALLQIAGKEKCPFSVKFINLFSSIITFLVSARPVVSLYTWPLVLYCVAHVAKGKFDTNKRIYAGTVMSKMQDTYIQRWTINIAIAPQKIVAQLSFG